jgi:hypothetical protein
MAAEGFNCIVDTFKTATDLSAAQYCFVKLSAADTVAICAATTDIPIGILQNKPTSGQAAEVMVCGKSKLKCAAATTYTSMLATDGSGLGAIVVAGTDTTRYVVARARDTTANANGYATVYVNCVDPHRAA